MREAKIFSLAMAPEAGQYLVTLEEVDGTRLIPIWVGPAEGISIAAALQKQDFPRPLTHDLIINMLKELGAIVEKVVVTDLREDTFYANILISMQGKEYILDSRPSDSMAIAIRAQAKIFIDEQVFEKCPRIDKPISEKEVEEFKDQISDIKPEDFFKGQS